MRLCRQIFADQGGASVIELALVAPIFASMLIGMVDLSRAYSAKLQLEQAAQRSIEKVQQYQTSSNTFSTLSAEASSAATAAGFTSPVVTVDFWLECDGTRQTDYNTHCSTGQTYGRWLTVDIAATYSPMFASRHWPGANADGTFTLHGKAGLRTQ